ncbi:signal peptidase II [Gammaproteobacteria bacterium]|nr:signal peptidase II [Gammaproteobacteria bacterium]
MSAKQKTEFRTSVLFSISFLIFILDQITKYLSNTYLNLGQPVTVFPGFDLLLAYNSGAAFSFLSDAGGWQRWLLTAFSSAISLLLVFWIFRLPKTEKLAALALCLILGGAWGNLYDRIFDGYVVDFISVYYKSYRFATFNIADSAVFLGACLMMLDIFRNRPTSPQSVENINTAELATEDETENIGNNKPHE